MKKGIILIRILIIAALLLNIFNLSAQKLVKNSKDEFTGALVKETSWETVVMKSNLTLYSRARKINDQYILDFKITMGGSVFSMDKGDEIMFKLSNGKIQSIENAEYSITSSGGGARGLAGSNMQGLEASFYVDQNIIDDLKTYNIEKIRIYTTDGYVEEDVNKDKDIKFKSLLKLVTDEL